MKVLLSCFTVAGAAYITVHGLRDAARVYRASREVVRLAHLMAAWQEFEQIEIRFKKKGSDQT